jgi:hypothetical protein
MSPNPTILNAELSTSEGGAQPDATDAVESSVEWATKFARYLQRSAERLGETAELNKELTKRIAYGDVPPVIVESQLAAFLATNAESYAAELADLTMNFLARLIGLSSDHVCALVQGIASPAPAPARPAPPRFDPTDPVEWFERLNQYAAEEASIAEAIVRSAVDPVACVDRGECASDDNVSSEPLSMAAAKTVDTFLELLTRLEDMNSDYGRRYLTAVLGLARDSEKSGATLQAVASLGQTATARFAIANNSNADASVRCALTDLRRSDGVGPAFEPDATLTPNNFRLPVGAEEVIQLSVRLAECDFEEGPLYTGGVRVLGIGDAVVEIPLNLRVSISEDRCGSVAELP